MPNEKISMIPLGGYGEIGKNMMVVEYREQIIIIDSGIAFPEEDLLGIDVIIPDISYLLDKRDKIRGILLTHGHEDHIGAVPYVLKKFNPPIYGTNLTLGLLEGKLEEADLLKQAQLREVKTGDVIQVGPFEIEYIRVNHSIVDSAALAIHTPYGPIVYASDFKFDQTPIDGKTADFHKLAELGDKKPLALFSDSTNVEREGYTKSETTVGERLGEIFLNTKSRIIVASFASNVDRIQQIVDAAQQSKRKVAITGRSMVNNVQIARKLGYLDIPDHLMIDLREINNYPEERVVLITTGSQGEPMAALTRMSDGEHNQIAIREGDTVIISATAIPGNEKLVNRTMNKLFKRGANVIYGADSGVHVSGHASREELKLMLNLIRPKFFVPVHGEYRHLVHHAQLAEDLGVKKDNIFLLENGDVLEMDGESGEIVGQVTAGRVLVDGLGVGDVGNVVLRDRRLLSEDGILIVVITIDSQTGDILAGPDILTRGFVYVRESEELIEETQAKVRKALKDCEKNNITDWSTLKSTVKDAISNYLYRKTQRRPMILPIIMEV